ncbi:polyribonucleotide nucleotidyltransferase [Candidatus Acetothermia bacterium]|nr:polyribonucleotide nucleotidyltransferase [Candidatus Acetothermia bacterium]
MTNLGTVELSCGPFTLSTGKLARQADSAVIVTYGETMVLCTVARGEAKDIGYFPLTVDYEERYYATGKIPGGFLKREGRPSEDAILSARMIDRPIRPLFPRHYQEELQVIVTVLSADQDHLPSIAGLLGASTALMTSKAPFLGPVAGVRVGRVNGELIANPNAEQRSQSDVDIVVVGTKEAILMLEGKMSEVPEKDAQAAIEFAHTHIKELVAFQEEFIKKIPVKKVDVTEPENLKALKEIIKKRVGNRFEELRKPMTKLEREALADSLKEEILEKLSEEKKATGVTEEDLEEFEKVAKTAYEDLLEEYVRQTTLKSRVRIDGRKSEDLRSITCEVGILPRVHGSSLFTRGETQSLGTVTLGTSKFDEQIIDRMLQEGKQRFMLHYNFPKFSVGEPGRLGAPGRREIGHGKLAENSVSYALPSEEEFPYVIRVVSETLESNGSSSMATVCSSTLALMDAGVPIKKPVAGIAMGLVMEGDEFMVLTDLAGYEDSMGDMDFKLAGTRDGLTGFQLDIKLYGISPKILWAAMLQARDARMKILDMITKTIPAPRAKLSQHAPLLEVIPINPEKIGAIIGPGGKTIRKIIAETGAEIDIDDEKAHVKISGPNAEAVQKARARVEQLTEDLAVGNVYEGKVVRIEKFGAFVELPNGTNGLVRVQELSAFTGKFVKRVEDAVKFGDILKVEVAEIDDMGRANLRVYTERKPVKVGDTFIGIVSGTTDFGAFVDLEEAGVRGLIHISKLSDGYVEKVEDVVKVGDRVAVEVLKIEQGKYSLKRIARPDENSQNKR